MSRIRMVVDVDDLRVEPLGVKEAVTMALEFLGNVRVLSVEVQEPEQMKLGPPREPSASGSRGERRHSGADKLSLRESE